MPTDGISVLFVCTANIARSPYAEHRARQLAGDAPVVFASAGIPGLIGRSMDEGMARELEARGAGTPAHASRPVTRELIDASDLVLTAEFGQRMRLLDAWPHAASRVFGLRQAALASAEGVPAGRDYVAWLARHAPLDSMTLDVGDPHLRGQRAARVCADEIDAALAALLPAILGRPLDPSVAPRPTVTTDSQAPSRATARPWWRRQPAYRPRRAL